MCSKYTVFMCEITRECRIQIYFRMAVFITVYVVFNRLAKEALNDADF